MSFVDKRARLPKCSTLSLNSEEIWKHRLHRKHLRHTFLSCDWTVCCRLIQSIRLHWWCNASCFIRFPQLQSTPVFLYFTDVTRAIAHRALSSSKTQVTQLSTVPKLLLCWHTQSTRDFSANALHTLCCNFVLSKFCAFAQITHHSPFSNWKGLPCICLKNSFCANSPENAWQVLLQHQLSQDTH